MKMKHHPSFYITCILTSLTIILTLVFSHTNNFVSAESTNAAVSVSSVCAVTTTDNGNHIVNLIPGEDSEIVGISINVSCNDGDGYSLYAIGFSGDSYIDSNHTKLISAIGANYDIPTNTSGDNSYWAMKVTSSGTNAPIVDNSYNDYQVIPDVYTKISHLTTSTTGIANSSITIPTYKISVADNQAAGTYVGKVKYTLVHPNGATKLEIPTLHDSVVAEWETGGSRVQTNDANPDTGIQATITTDNSGVFKYNSAVFGIDSDAAKSDGTKDVIYYFRGILDETLGTYGSDGDGVAWPNYVVLSPAASRSDISTEDTCWRIVRTTASGGVKMIYNGKWTGSTCANATTNTASGPFNSSSSVNGYSSLNYRNIHAVGYTYNSRVNGITDASADTTIAKVFGSNDNYSINDSDSIVKQYLEKTWFTKIGDYENILEPSAGYCNDRTLYPDGQYALANQFSENISIAPYSSTTVYYFGAYARNITAAQSPTLACPRGVVDLYSATLASGNGQLDRPIALLTADEASFAGSGRGTAAQGSSYNVNSYLNSSTEFWLLSPQTRYSNTFAGELTLRNGYIYTRNLSNYLQMRPVISLVAGITPVGGNGTAASPWIINPPSS